MHNHYKNSKTFSARIRQRIFIHLSQFKNTLKTYPKIIIALKFIQTLLVLLILFEQSLFRYLTLILSPSATNTINSILTFLFQTSQFLIAFVCIIGIILILQIGHCLFLKTQFKNELHQERTKKMCVFIVLLYFILALFEVPCLFNLGKTYSQTRNLKWLIALCLTSISFWPFTIIEFSQCPILFDFAIIVIIPLLSVADFNLKFLLIFVVALFFSYVKETKFEKTFYVILALVSGWNFVDQQVIGFSLNTLGRDKIVLIVLSILLLPYLVFKASNQCIKNDDKEQVNKLLELILTTKTENLLQSNDFQTVFNAWQIVMKFTGKQNETNTNENRYQQKYKQKQRKKQKQKQIRNLTKTDLINYLTQHIKDTIISQKDISNRILYLKLKILSKSKLINVFDGVQSLMSLHFNSSLTLRQQFLLIQFQKYLEQQLFHNQNDQQVNTPFIIQKALDTQEFYTSAADSFRQVIKFWSFFRRKHKSKTQISRFFHKIINSENQLRQKFLRLTEYRNIGKQKKLMIEIENILNGHSLISQNVLNSSENSSYEGQRNQQVVQNSFLMLEEGKIIRCSFEFINEMGYSLDELTNADSKVIFGERFVSFLESQLRQVTFQKKRSVVVPVYNKQRQILIKECSIWIYPEMKCRVKYFVSFSDVDKVNRTPFILYSPVTDSIQYVNARFISEFQLDAVKISQKVQQNNLLSNQLFSKIDLTSIQTKQLLKQEKPVNCEFINGNLSFVKLQKIPVNVSLISQFSTISQSFYILLIRKGIFIKTEMTITEHEPTKQRIKDNENLNMAQKYRNQKYFCPINNNYSIKITQKLSQIADKDRKNYVFYLKALFIVTVLLLLGQFIYSFVETENRISDLLKDEQFIHNRNNDYIRISYMYSLFFKSEYFRNFPLSLTFMNADMKIDEVLQFYLKEMQKTVGDFLTNHLTTLRSHDHNVSIPYKLKFDNFQILTDTTKSTFLDFSEKFSQYIKSYERQFLFDNYFSFRDLSEKFSNIDLSTEKINQTFESSSFTVYIILIVTFPLLLIALFLSIKIELSINQMYQLLDLVQEKDSQEVIEKINDLKGKLKEVESIFKKKEKQICSSKFQTHRIIEQTDKLHQQKNRQQQIQNLKIKTYDEKDSQNSQQSQPLSSKISQLTDNKQGIEHKKEIQNDSVLILLTRNVYFVIFFGLVTVIIFLQNNQRNSELNIFQSLLKYQKQLFHTQSGILQLENDLYFKAEYTQFFKPNNFSFYQSHSLESLHYFSNLQEKKQFESFNQKQYSLLFGDLCVDQPKYFINLQGLDCSTTGGGILQHGFSQAYSIYSKMTNQLRNLTLDKFLTQPCINLKCPVFIEEFYLNLRLVSLINEHISEFRSFINTIAENQRKENEVNLVIEIGILLVLVVGFGIWIHFLGKRCKISIKMFQLIPPYIMKKMKITTFIRKNNVLSSISVL